MAIGPNPIAATRHASRAIVALEIPFPEGVLVLNARDKRAIAWMIEQVGFVAVQEACGRLAGRRRLYPTNLAKVLGLTIPDSVVITPASAALEQIRELRRRFPGLG